MMNATRALVLIVSMVFASMTCAAPSCEKTASVCVEPGGTRNINGAQVHKHCWRYKDTYSCIKNTGVDTCSGLRAAPGCVQLSSTCEERAFNGDCLRFSNLFRCNAKQTIGATTVELEPTYTITEEGWDGACLSLEANSSCKLTGSVCVDSAPKTRKVNGLDVTKECWKKQDTYACVAASDDCQALKGNAKCTLRETVCESQNVDGTCALTAYKYRCEQGTTPSTEVTTCTGGTFCIEGTCFEQPVAADQDFAKAASLLEAGRQAAGYAQDSENLKFFSGEDKQCGKNFLNSCCKTKGGGGAMSNGAVVSNAVNVGKAAYGSWFTFDMMTDSMRSTNALGAIYSKFASPDTLVFQGGSGSWSGFSYYGITFNPLANGSMFSFDPTSFAISMAIAVLTEMLSCDQSEIILGMQKGQNLCHYVGSYCSDKFLGVCLSRKESYCCFNSKLALLIQEQGRPQLGKSWGGAESPSCGGFTQVEFDRLDMSKMDLSAFVSDIMANTQLPQFEGTSEQTQETVKQKILDYYAQ
jgi:conjugal transfer mating pair stabilization protein TraN